MTLHDPITNLDAASQIARLRRFLEPGPQGVLDVRPVWPQDYLHPRLVEINAPEFLGVSEQCPQRLFRLYLSDRQQRLSLGIVRDDITNHNG